jgi:hypothetical protein
MLKPSDEFGQNLTLALTLGVGFFRGARAFTESQVNKVHELKGFLNALFILLEL